MSLVRLLPMRCRAICCWCLEWETRWYWRRGVSLSPSWSDLLVWMPAASEGRTRFLRNAPPPVLSCLTAVTFAWLLMHSSEKRIVEDDERERERGERNLRVSSNWEQETNYRWIIHRSDTSRPLCHYLLSIYFIYYANMYISAVSLPREKRGVVFRTVVRLVEWDHGWLMRGCASVP